MGWGLVAQEKGGQRGQGPLCPYSLVVIVRLVLPSYLIEVCYTSNSDCIIHKRAYFYSNYRNCYEEPLFTQIKIQLLFCIYVTEYFLKKLLFKINSYYSNFAI